MLIPSGEPVFTGLSTSFIAFEELVRDLSSRKLTGALQLAAPGYAGTVLFSGGTPLNALAEDGEGRVTGLAAANQIAARARLRDGEVSVFALPAPLTALLSRAVDGQLVHGGLSTAFTNFEKLLAQLQTEGHSGYLQLRFAGSTDVAMVFLEAGRLVDAVHVTDGRAESGPEAAEAALRRAEEAGGTCDVYRAGEPAPRRTGRGDETPLPAPAPAGGNPIPAWEEILAATEAVVDELSAPGTFLLALKETLVDRAAEYPFLDPFAAELEYRDGTLTYQGTPPADLSRALGECLADTVARLAFRLKRADLERRIQERTQGIDERHREAFEHFDLSACTQELIA